MDLMDWITAKALAAALAGGFFLAGFGAAISIMNAWKRDTFAYLFWNALFTIPLAFFLLGKPSALLNDQFQRLPELVWWVSGGGVASIGGSLCVQAAMRNGSGNLAWAIQQASLVIPFIAGALFFSQRCGAFQTAGVLLIVAGIFYPVLMMKDSKKGKRGFLPFALGAFVLMGGSEMMQNIPSYWKDWRDVGELRSALAYAGGAFGSGMSALFLRKTLLPLGPIWKPALLMAFWNLATVSLMFHSLDWCAEAKIGSMGYPVIVGSSIVFFALYSVFISKEKTPPAAWCGLGGILAGIAVIAL